MIDLGQGQAWAINDRDQVIGDTTGGSAFLWQNGEMTDIGSLGGGGGGSSATAINDRGQIVGDSSYGGEGKHGFHTRAFLWENGTMHDLGTVGGNQATATALNNHGQIIGTSSTKNGKTHAVLWTLRSG